MERKKEHVASCKGLVDAIARAEEDVNNEVRKLHKQCDVRIEQEKKAFKAGYEERLQKVVNLLLCTCLAIGYLYIALQVLSVKSRECIEFTAKALAPEFARLRANHEREVLDVERRMRREERELRDTVDSQTQAEMDQIEVELANEFGQLLVGLREGSREELQALERDQRRRVQTVLEEGRRELEDLKQQLARRNTEPRLK
jgi:trans-2-enoyl-CoA reductase